MKKSNKNALLGGRAGACDGWCPMRFGSFYCVLVIVDIGKASVRRIQAFKRFSLLERGLRH
jgi:hypothetical protein